MEEQYDKDCYHDDYKSSNTHEKMKYFDNSLVKIAVEDIISVTNAR
jgi:hypothetical protein